MTSPVNSLLRAITGTLLQNTTVLGIIGNDGMKDRHLHRTAQPYLMVGDVESKDLSTDGDGLLECFVTLQAWSSTSRREVEVLADLLRNLLHDADLALAQASLVSIVHVKTVSRREVKTALYLAEVQFRVVIGT
ncbi:DUF3168 domain-containing protein [Rhizobium oryziradicis]|uniref:DUF3168 domain-containing protein n=1 Tax=Rhizobium oryziradicis TaxID=1867956 RepID=A0A1Q8ZXS0_9HYPH|nr:DUF3168 domain-containing protein [Rhizobium oryziradicis]OLP46868.1 hypothetical protein BJF95_14365 [Rhizobium oryziradicis]